MLDTTQREFKFRQTDFQAIATVLRAEAGIYLPETKAPLVYARLVKRLRALNLTDFADYVHLLQSKTADDEKRHLLSALTTNVTRFFREPHHFTHLKSTVLQPLSRTKSVERFRLWSAACSTGQEPFSIAALVADTIPHVRELDLKILATDIDPVVVEQARNGRYSSIEGVPPELRRWFERDGDGWVIDPALQRLVTFNCLNLNARWPMRGPFDVIFCRNVAIYFDGDVQAALWSSFAEVARPGGFLYIGHSERVSGAAASRFDNVGITTYRRRGAGP